MKRGLTVEAGSSQRVVRRGLLKQHQVGVLRWIGEGCPAGVMQGHVHKTVAVALQNRRLVEISRRAGSWRAAITAAGQHYLTHGDYPTEMQARPGSGRSPTFRPQQTAVVPDLDGDRAGNQEAASQASASRAASRKHRSPTDQMIADLQAAGGELIVDRSKEGASYQARVAAAIRSQKVPTGKLLVVKTGRKWEELIIRLQDEPAWLRASLEPVPVPVRLAQPHAVVSELRGHTHFRVGKLARQRALLLIHALVSEAERRGHVVTATKETVDRNGYRSRPVQDDFTVTVHGHGVGVRLVQQSDRTPHVPTPSELHRAQRESLYRIPSHDVRPSERLTLQLSGAFEHRQSTWNDTAHQSLNDHLCYVIQEIELRAAAMERARLEREEAARQQRLRWEAAMEVARLRLIEAERAKHLHAEVEQARRAADIRWYCDQLERRAENRSSEVAEWTAWARAYAERIDPLTNPPGMQEPAKATPEALKPFLDGWSPYGPDRWR